MKCEQNDDYSKMPKIDNTLVFDESVPVPEKNSQEDDDIGEGDSQLQRVKTEDN